MAFLYLDEVADAILSELVNEFQENVSLSCQVMVPDHLYMGTHVDTVCLSISNLCATSILQWRSQVDQTARPFRFIHYDPIIQRKQREYRDTRGGGGSSNHANSKLNEDLSEIQTIMRMNIDEILNRGEKLDHVSSISNELQQKSKDFKWGAKKLTWQARLQQYGPVVAGSSIVLLVLYLKFFL